MVILLCGFSLKSTALVMRRSPVQSRCEANLTKRCEILHAAALLFCRLSIARLFVVILVVGKITFLGLGLGSF